MKIIIVLFTIFLFSSHSSFAALTVEDDIKVMRKELNEYKKCRAKIKFLSQKKTIDCLLKGNDVLLKVTNIHYRMHENLVYTINAPLYESGRLKNIW